MKAKYIDGILNIKRVGDSEFRPQYCINPQVYSNPSRMTHYCDVNCPLAGDPYKDTNRKKGSPYAEIMEFCSFKIASTTSFFTNYYERNKALKD